MFGFTQKNDADSICKGDYVEFLPEDGMSYSPHHLNEVFSVRHGPDGLDALIRIITAYPSPDGQFPIRTQIIRADSVAKVWRPQP